jgi:hypothetical protein
LTFSVCDTDKLAFASKANRALDHTKKTRLASALLSITDITVTVHKTSGELSALKII